MDFRMLGPLEVVDDDRPVALGKGKQRALLGALLLHRNEVVSADRLIDELWGEKPPSTALTALQGYVSQLRKRLGTERLETVPPGYRLRVAPDELDAARFEQLVGQRRYGEALGLWRGAALADFAYEPFAQGEIVRLEELRLACLEGRIASELAAGRQGELVGELEALVQEHPLRERFRAQLMLALYGSGRQAEALEAFQAARTTLVEELGIEPGEELKELQRRILAHDPELAVAPSGAAEPVAPVEEPPPPEPSRVRKTVTILFCDLVESTALGEELDPEVVDDVLRRYYETVSAVAARHGGTVQKYAGDAVMAVFGIPRVHEDDALRALRAASELPAALSGLAVRIGVNTGEVVAGGDSLVAGDAVSVAARLEGAAASAEILFGDATWRLVRDAVEAELLELPLKGKAKPVSAWRLLELVEGKPAMERQFEASFVGRDRELRRLRDAFTETAERQVPQLFTILGTAGIGKTRLTSEFIASLDGTARVLVGRCLPYGEGITYWPLVEIGKDLGAGAAREAFAGERDGDLLASHAVGALGLAEVTAGKDEIFLAVRKLFEALAREQPLVVVFEDIHWAEPTLLDLIEEIAEVSRDCALLLLCLARHELLEERTGWGGGRLNATSLLLDPLSAGESDLLIDRLLGSAPLEPDARRRIAEAAEGNPLFVEQMLALIGSAELDDGELLVPPTIQALLAARLDRLGPAERAVIAAAAVVGKEFWGQAVAELLPEPAHNALPRHLDGLVRKELVAPYGSPFFGMDGFRFRHILIQDAAYRAIPKRLRAELHERFATWLEKASDAAEYVEILGYHYEQASKNRAELDPTDADALRLAEMGSDLLVRAGIRAGARDWAAAQSLLERAAALLPAAHPSRPRVLLELGYAYRQAASFERSRGVLSEALKTARSTADDQREVLASMLLAANAFSLSPDARALDRLQDAARRAVDTTKLAANSRWLAISLEKLAFSYLLELRFVEAEKLLLSALDAARIAADPFEADVFDQLANTFVHGPTPIGEALDHMRKLEGDRGLRLDAANLATLNAMRGDFDTARHLTDKTSLAEATGRALKLARLLQHRGEIEALAGNLGTAERYASAAHELAESHGLTLQVARIASDRAYLLVEQGRDDEALGYAELSEACGKGRRGSAQLRAKMTRARVLARRGDSRNAERLAREVLGAVPPDSGAHLRASQLLGYAEVLGLRGDTEDAEKALREALALAERKEDVVTAGRAKAALEALPARVTRPHSARRAARR